MDKRIKVLLVSLGIVSLCAVLLSLWIYLTSQTKVVQYSRRQSELEEQTAQLQEQLVASQKDTSHWRNLWKKKSQEMTDALNKLGKEHTQLQNQFSSLEKEKSSLVSERDDLLEKSQLLQEQIRELDKLYFQQRTQEGLRGIKAPTDKFLTELLEEKAALEVQVEKLKAVLSSEQTKLEVVREQARPAEKEIEVLRLESQSLQEKLGDSKKVTDILSRDLLRERKNRRSLEEEIAKTEQQLSELSQERDRVSEQLLRMKQALEQRLAELNKTKKTLEKAVEGAKMVVQQQQQDAAFIELPPIIVKAVTEKLALPPYIPDAVQAPTKKEGSAQLSGRIIMVNEQHRFVVVDLGLRDGLKKGMSLAVYRQGLKIAKIEVIEPRKNIAACDIKLVNVKQLKVDDIVHR